MSVTIIFDSWSLYQTDRNMIKFKYFYLRYVYAQNCPSKHATLQRPLSSAYREPLVIKGTYYLVFVMVYGLDSS